MYETRGLEVRQIDDDHGGFTARILKYNTADHHGSVWRPAVFRSSLERSLPISCWSHDLSRPIGRAIDYEDRADHLDTHVRLADPDDVPDARMARSLLKDKIVDGFSFTFDRHAAGTLAVPREQRSAYGPLKAREMIISADLIEISPVVAPSGLDTQLLAVRSQEGATQMDDTMSPADIARLVETKVMTPEEGRAMLEETRGRPIVLNSARSLDERVRECLEEHDPDLALEARGLTLEPVTESVIDPDTVTLAEAVDKAFVEVGTILRSDDPEAVAHAIEFADAGTVATAELLDGLDAPDPDGQRARRLEERAAAATETSAAESGESAATREIDTAETRDLAEKEQRALELLSAGRRRR